MTNDTTVRVPQQARSIEKKNRLIASGMTLFGKKGFLGTNAKEIAKEAGVSVGTFYAYFPDKKALLMEIVGRHMAEVNTAVFPELQAMLRSGTTGREILRRTVRLAHASHHHSPELLRVMLAMRYTDEDISRVAAAENRNMVANFTRLLTATGDRLRIKDPEAAALVVASAFEETMHSVAVFGPAIERDRIYEALADMAAVYLFTDPDLPIR